MRKQLDKALGGSICAIFIVGCYSIAHFVLRTNDQTIMIFALALIWSHLTAHVNKDEGAPHA